MKKIMIIGSPGAGKSYLSKKLSARTGLPLYHLDQLYWKPGWIEPEVEDWETTQEELVKKPAWILDGNYGGTMRIRLAAADTIVFLDFPTYLTISRVIIRTLFHLNRSRPDMPADCPERFERKFFLYVWTYRKNKRPGLLKRMANLKVDQKVITIRSKKEMNQFLSSIPVSGSKYRDS